MAKELFERNYMEALLRATLVLGDKHRKTPVREAAVAGYKMDGDTRILHPRCTMTIQDENAADGEDYLILYQM